MEIIKVNAFLNMKKFARQADIKIIESSLWTYYSDIRAVKNIMRRELISIGQYSKDYAGQLRENKTDF